ncbi:MAG: anaerobic glycerol-3-phosphate dehydrogenase subunit GlpB [Peptococcaceae bacterium]
MLNCDVAVIGAGLAGLSAALAAVQHGKSTIVAAKGMGNLYSASGYIDFLGYYPTTARQGLENPLLGVNDLIRHNPEHPYAMIGKEDIAEAFQAFIRVSKIMGLPYTGSLTANILIPTAAGALVPTALYPAAMAKKIADYDNIIVAGIREHADFYPEYAAHNLEKQLGKKVKPVWIDLGIRISRELNSFDLALILEQKTIRQSLINQFKSIDTTAALILMPAVLGVWKWQETLEALEKGLNCKILEIPTLPPSVMGYRLAEALTAFLKKCGAEFIIGHPVSRVTCSAGLCREIMLDSASGRELVIRAPQFCLATGGILGEGLQVGPQKIAEAVFKLPVITPGWYSSEEFFSLEGQPLSRAGVKINEKLQPVDPQTNKVVLHNVYVAGATLAGYDPFVEKSGNGVALTSGYKAGLLAAKGGSA